MAVAGAMAQGVLAQTIAPAPQDRVDAVAALIGDRLTAKPAKARRILVFWRCEGFVHRDSIPLGNKAFELAAQKTKAFSVDCSDDYAALRPENLAKYDALVLNNTTALKTELPENHFIEPALLAFVRSGKGLAVIHAGADNFNKADACAQMVGGRFWGHPWGAGGTWAFNLEEPDHACCAHSLKTLGAKYKLGDEIYQQRSPFYSRAKLRVLLSLDLSDPATAEAKGQTREDKDYAVSWVRPFGKGRVFYTSYGHDQRAWMKKETLQHIFDGVQYAIGDLQADDTPAGLSEADLARVKGAGDDPAYIAAFSFLQDILANTGSEKVDAANIAKLQALLKDPATTKHGKKAVLRALIAVNAPAADIPAVAALLSDKDATGWAAQWLAGTPGKAASAALAAALKTAPADEKTQILNAFAIRKESDAIAPYIADKDETVAKAALSALGRVGDKAALDALAKPAAAALEDTRKTALAAALGTLADSGEARAAAKTAQALFKDTQAEPWLRAAAARALLAADKTFFAPALQDASPLVRGAVLRNVDGVPAKALAAALKSASPADQAALAVKLAALDARAQAGEVAALLASPEADTVFAALKALKTIGGAEQVPAIFALLDREGRVRDAAREALTDMKSGAATGALIALAGGDAEKQKKILPFIGDRLETRSLAQLADFVKSPDNDVRKEVWKAAGKLADEKTLGTLFAWLPAVQDAELNQAESAIRAVGKNAEAPALIQSWKTAWNVSSVPAKKALAGLATGYGDDALVPLLASALNDADNGLRETAIRALGDWPTLAPFDVLSKAAVSQSDGGLKTAALRGALKLVAAHAGDDFGKRSIDLFRVAADDRARLTVADALFRRDGLSVFKTFQGLFNDPELGAAAKKTYVAFYDSHVKGKTGSEEIKTKGWKADASHNGREASRAFDRNPGTRWTSNHSSEKGMWYTLDLGQNFFIAEAVLDTEGSGGDTPNGCEVFISNDGKAWSGPVAAVGDTKKKTEIPLSVQARYLKFVTTGGRSGLHWSIHELYLKAGLDPKKAEEIQKVADSVR
jgi:type 1 glutamine amidotransferase/HEAT repeat protein